MGTNGTAITKGARKMRSQLRKLINSSENAVVVQGCQLMLSLSEDSDMRAVLEELCSGTTITEEGRLELSRSSEVFKRCKADSRTTVALCVLGASGRLEGLESLDLSRDPSLHDLSGLSRCTTLKKLNISGGEDLKQQGASFQTVDPLANCPALVELDLTGCYDLQNLDALTHCPALRTVTLSRCRGLKNVNGLLNCTALTHLEINICWALENLDGLVNCVALTHVNLDNCTTIQNLDGLKNSTSLSSLSLRHCSSLQNLDGIANCTAIDGLQQLYKCTALQSVAGLWKLTKLTKMHLIECSSLMNLSGLKHITSLDISKCSALVALDGLAEATALRKLEIRDCDSLKRIDGLPLQKLELRNCASLRSIVLEGSALTHMTVSECPSLISLEGACPAVTIVHINGCDSLQSLEGLSSSSALRTLGLRRCRTLANIDILTHLSSLSGLSLSTCPKISSLDPLEHCLKLESLSFHDLGIRHVNALSKCAALKKLSISGPAGTSLSQAIIDNLDGLSGLTSLQTLEIRYLPALKHLDGIAGCKALKEIDISACSGLVHGDGLADLSELSSLRLRDIRRTAYSQSAWSGPFPRTDCLSSREAIAAYQDRLREARDKRVKSKSVSIEDFAKQSPRKVRAQLRKWVDSHNKADIARACELLALMKTTPKLRPFYDEFVAGTQLSESGKVEWGVEFSKRSKDWTLALFVLRLTGQNKGATRLDLSDTLITKVDELAHWKDLSHLDLSECKELVSTEGLSELTSLKSLNLKACNSLKRLDVSGLAKLHTLNISYCYGLCALSPLPGLRSLTAVSCRALKGSDFLSGLTTLERLTVNGLSNSDCLRSLVALQELNLPSCSLPEIDGLAWLKNLRSLSLASQRFLTHLDGLSGLSNLETLQIRHCGSLKNFDALASLTGLKKLDLAGCPSLTDVDCLSGLTGLQTLDLRSCIGLRNVDGLARHRQLAALYLDKCSALPPEQAINHSGLENVQAFLNRYIRAAASPIHALRNRFAEGHFEAAERAALVAALEEAKAASAKPRGRILVGALEAAVEAFDSGAKTEAVRELYLACMVPQKDDDEQWDEERFLTVNFPKYLGERAKTGTPDRIAEVLMAVGAILSDRRGA